MINLICIKNDRPLHYYALFSVTKGKHIFIEKKKKKKKKKKKGGVLKKI